MADRYLKETSGTDGYQLEDGSGVLLLDQLEAPPSTFKRNAMVIGIAVMWSLTVAVPAFSSTSQTTRKLVQPGQGQSTQILRLKPSAAPISINWIPPPITSLWKMRGLQEGVAVTTSPAAFTLIQQSSILLWPQQVWDSQTTRKLVQPGQGQASPTLERPLSNQAVWLWPQPEWPSQTTRKLVQPGQGQASPALERPLSAQAVWLWPQPEWPSQTTRKLVQPGQGQASQTLERPLSAQAIWLWPQPVWDSQTTRKVGQPGQGQANAVLFDHASSRPIGQWIPLSWESQTSQKAPILPTVSSEVPPIHRIDVIWSSWSLSSAVPMWQSRGFQETILEEKTPVIRTRSAPIFLWPELAWDSQTTRKTPIPTVITQVPSRNRMDAILATWAETHVIPIQQSVIVQEGPAPVSFVIAPPIGTPIWLWPPLDWPTQVTRKAPIPDVPGTPFVRASSKIIEQWPQLDWLSQTTRKVVQPGQGQATQTLEPPLSAQAIWLWPQPEWPSQTTRKIVQSGQGQASTILFTHSSSRPIAEWPPLDWATQDTRKAPIPTVVAQVPSRNRMDAILTNWPSTDWLSQTVEKQIQPGQGQATQNLFSRATSRSIAEWPPLDWASQTTRKTVIPSIPSVPYSRASWQPIAQWTPVVWESQRVRTNVQPERADNPPFGGQRLWLRSVLQLWEPGPPQPIARQVVNTPSGPPVVATDDIWYYMHNVRGGGR